MVEANKVNKQGKICIRYLPPPHVPQTKYIIEYLHHTEPSLHKYWLELLAICGFHAATYVGMVRWNSVCL